MGIGAVLLLVGPLYDVIYLSSGTLKPYLYYSRRGRFTRDILIISNRHGHNHFAWDRVTEDLDEFQGEDRVWVLFSGVWRARNLNEEDVFLKTARQLGVEKQLRTFAGVNIYLFDFSE